MVNRLAPKTSLRKLTLPKRVSFFYVHFEGIRQSQSVSMTQLSMEGDANKGPLQQKALEMTASMDLDMGMNRIAGESTAAAPPPEWEKLKEAQHALKNIYLI